PPLPEPGRLAFGPRLFERLTHNRHIVPCRPCLDRLQVLATHAHRLSRGQPTDLQEDDLHDGLATAVRLPDADAIAPPGRPDDFLAQPAGPRILVRVERISTRRGSILGTGSTRRCTTGTN